MFQFHLDFHSIACCKIGYSGVLPQNTAFFSVSLVYLLYLMIDLVILCYDKSVGV